MINKKIITASAAVLFAAWFIFFDSHSLEHENHGHESANKETEEHADHNHTVKNSAVKDFCTEDGLLLSENAAAAIGLKTVRISEPTGKNILQVPAGALVYYRDRVCVYIINEERFTETDVQVIKISGGTASIKISGKFKGGAVVTEGADILRLTFLEASGATGSGHIH
jgi:hypothetical protein